MLGKRRQAGLDRSAVVVLEDEPAAGRREVGEVVAERARDDDVLDDDAVSDRAGNARLPESPDRGSRAVAGSVKQVTHVGARSVGGRDDRVGPRVQRAARVTSTALRCSDRLRDEQPRLPVVEELPVDASEVEVFVRVPHRLHR